MGAPTISVLVPVHNPGDRLNALATRILDEQTYPAERIELVVVDDSSDDGAVQRLCAERANDARLVTASANCHNCDEARNKARSLASGELLAMTDDDCMPERDWLATAVQKIEPGEILAGHVRFAHSTDPTIWELFDISYHLDQERYVSQGVAVTGNLFVWAATFDQLNGLDETALMGGDFEFVSRAVRAGVPLSYSRVAAIEHPTRADRREYLKKIHRVARAEGFELRNASAAVRAVSVIPGIATAMRMVKQRRLTVLNAKRLAEHDIAVSLTTQAKATLVELFVVGTTLAGGRLSGLRDSRVQDKLAPRPS